MWDGYRFLWHLSDGGVGCWTRHGNRHDGKLPYIEEELRRLLPEGTVVDGELVALGAATALAADGPLAVSLKQAFADYGAAIEWAP